MITHLKVARVQMLRCLSSRHRVVDGLCCTLVVDEYGRRSKFLNERVGVTSLGRCTKHTARAPVCDYGVCRFSILLPWAEIPSTEGERERPFRVGASYLSGGDPGSPRGSAEIQHRPYPAFPGPAPFRTNVLCTGLSPSVTVPFYIRAFHTQHTHSHVVPL